MGVVKVGVGVSRAKRMTLVGRSLVLKWMMWKMTQPLLVCLKKP